MKHRVLAALGVLGLVLGWIVVLAWLSVPAERGSFPLPGLTSTVSIRYDAWQRPYVEAATLKDALAAQGWLHARHRLWQMEMYRRAGQGQLAALLGSDLVAADREMWQIGVPDLARRLMANAAPIMRERVRRYVSGINAAIEQLPGRPPELVLLGAELRPWQELDVFAVGALTAYQSANNFRNELLRLALREKLGDEAFTVFLDDGSDAADFPLVMPRQHQLISNLHALSQTDPLENPLLPRLAFGSNGWVVAPEKSTTGHALFAFDSHDALGLPNLFYEVHLFFAGNKQIRGWSAPGLPGVINGYNEHMAWGFTNIGDTQDLFLEQSHPEQPHLLRDDQQWYAPERRMVTLQVKDSEPVDIAITQTRNGRLISESPPIALRWTALEREDISLDSLLALNRASDWRSFNAALDGFPAPTLNATWADTAGNIGFRTAGLLPRRGAGEGLFPQPGDRPERRWQGLVPAAEMPRQYNPSTGYLAAANARVNPPGSDVLVSADNATAYRIKRIQSVLDFADTISPADMAALQSDWTDGQAQALLGAMLSDLDPVHRQGAAGTAVELLRVWQDEAVATPDSAAALIFQRWYIALAVRVFQPRLGQALMNELLKRNYLLNHALDSLLHREDDTIWWQGRKAQLLADALNDAVIQLGEETGRPNPGDWRLDQLQQVGLPHELASAVPLLSALLSEAPQPTGGSTATVGRAGYRYDRPNRVRHAATVRVVANMAAVPQVAAVIPGGQSGHFLSRHYSDQFQAWLAGELLPVHEEPQAAGAVDITLLPPSSQ